MSFALPFASPLAINQCPFGTINPSGKDARPMQFLSVFMLVTYCQAAVRIFVIIGM